MVSEYENWHAFSLCINRVLTAQGGRSIGTMVSFRLAAVFSALTVASGERFNEIKVSPRFLRA